MLSKLGAKLTSDIKYEKIRNPANRKRTEILNGNRFIYMEPLAEGRFLPRTSFCAGLKCVILHEGQLKNERKNCAQTVGLKITCVLNASMKDAAESVKRQVTIRGQRSALITRQTRRTSSPSVGKTIFCPISFRPTSKSSGKLSNRLNRLFSTLRPCVVVICKGPN